MLKSNIVITFAELTLIANFVKIISNEIKFVDFMQRLVSTTKRKTHNLYIMIENICVMTTQSKLCGKLTQNFSNIWFIAIFARLVL